MSLYISEIRRSMEYLGSKQNTVFIGQAVAVPGTAMRNTLINIEESKLIEFPVDEDVQMGFSIGMALTGRIPISIFPRWNFLLLATNQIVNHLDKIKEMTCLKTPPKLIIRTGVGSEKPLHPGPQHTGDFTNAFRLMCKNINVVRLEDPNLIFDEYHHAYHRLDGVSTLFVEIMDLYNS